MLTDSNVRCAPVLETTASRLTPAHFQTVSEAFASVFDAMWWAAVTLTTVGYGDVYPVTPIGRIFTVLMLFVALGIIAIPTGLVASALSAIRAKEAAAAAAEDREAP
ncbi:potassium channel family protein [Inquilinus sp. YAF38]|uniref:potassium channel family protein n=1 Tax=Inquilinus sp. YAF38 TaxID=3233084 RepID=UPI003F8FFBDC